MTLIGARNTTAFKNKLDKFWETQELLINSNLNWQNLQPYVLACR